MRQTGLRIALHTGRAKIRTCSRQSRKQGGNVKILRADFCANVIIHYAFFRWFPHVIDLILDQF